MFCESAQQLVRDRNAAAATHTKAKTRWYTSNALLHIHKCVLKWTDLRVLSFFLDARIE